MKTRILTERQLVSKLKQIVVAKAELHGNSLTLQLRNVPLLEGGVTNLKETIEVVKHEEFVASWSKSDKLREDNDMVLPDMIYKDRYKLSLAVHEAVEKFVCYSFFSNKAPSEVYDSIHNIAEYVEKQFHIRKWGLESWNMYSDIVCVVFEMENP
jgi:hypothetical protein